jgi:hypothetical protein
MNLKGILRIFEVSDKLLLDVQDRRTISRQTSYARLLDSGLGLVAGSACVET